MSCRSSLYLRGVAIVFPAPPFSSASAQCGHIGRVSIALLNEVFLRQTTLPPCAATPSDLPDRVRESGSGRRQSMVGRYRPRAERADLIKAASGLSGSMKGVRSA
jgi:hypothetical protein